MIERRFFPFHNDQRVIFAILSIIILIKNSDFCNIIMQPIIGDFFRFNCYNAMI